MNTWWGFALSLIGVAGFLLAGRKVWWAWHINIANQVLWTIYSVVTQQWGFLIGVAVYTWVFWGNARRWTREHHEQVSEHEHRPFDLNEYTWIAEEVPNIYPDGDLCTCPRWTNETGYLTTRCPAHPEKAPRHKRHQSEEF